MFARFCIFSLILIGAATVLSVRAAGPGTHAPDRFTPDSARVTNPDASARNQRLYDSIQSKTSRRAVPRMLYRMLFVKPVLDTTMSGRVTDESRLLEPYAGRIMVGFESCRQHYKHPEKVAVTGTPVREDFFTLTKEAAKEKLGVNDGRPLIVSFWGSLGASGMNAQMADMLALEAGKEPFHHIHGAGKSGYAAVLKALAEKGVDLKDHPSLQVREYIYDMAPVMRAADLVICRAGASTVSELTALGVPAIMVPSPYVTNNHQEKNARALETHGGVEVLLEQNSSGQALFQTAAGILHDDVRREAMASAMAELGIRDAAQRIYETVQELL